MEDKSFELLEKMYSEFSKRFEKLEIGQRKLETVLENDIKVNLQALHERSEANTAKLDEHTHQLADINNKLDYLALSVNSQDKRLGVVESSRRKKAK